MSGASPISAKSGETKSKATSTTATLSTQTSTKAVVECYFVFPRIILLLWLILLPFTRASASQFLPCDQVFEAL